MINLKNSRRTIFFIFTLLILSSCNVKGQKYYYTVYNDNDTIDAYIIKKVNIDKQREEIDYMYKLNGEFKSKSKSTFIVSKHGLEKYYKDKELKKYKPYLNINLKECIEFKYPNDDLNDFASTSICFVGQEDLNIQGKNYKGAYKFKKELGDINSVVTYIYYDSNFTVILEEFIEGGRPYFRIERMDTTLDFEIPSP